MKLPISPPVLPVNPPSDYDKRLALQLTKILRELSADGLFVSLAAVADYANDAAAATGGVAVGQCYRTGSAIKVRVA